MQERDERWWRRMGTSLGLVATSTSTPAHSVSGDDVHSFPGGSREAPAAPGSVVTTPPRLSISDQERLTPEDALLKACTTGDLPEAQRLLREGADATWSGEFGTTPLSRAAEQGHVEVVSLLLSHGSRCDTQDDNGDSALLCACRMGHASVARVLLAEGADAGLTNNQGNDSLDAANEARNLLGRPEVSELLLGHRRGDNPLETQPRVMPLREDVLSAVNLASTPSRATLATPGPSGAQSHTGGFGRGPPSIAPSFTGTSLAGGVHQPGKHTPTLRLRREEWALDRNYPQCYLCKAPFTLMNRRHHCRSCGLVFCDKCTSSFVSMQLQSKDVDEAAHPAAPQVLRVRVCDTCATLHNGADRPGGLGELEERGSGPRGVSAETREASAGLASDLYDRMRHAGGSALERAKQLASKGNEPSTGGKGAKGGGAGSAAETRPRQLSIHTEAAAQKRLRAEIDGSVGAAGAAGASPGCTPRGVSQSSCVSGVSGEEPGEPSDTVRQLEERFTSKDELITPRDDLTPREDGVSPIDSPLLPPAASPSPLLAATPPTGSPTAARTGAPPPGSTSGMLGGEKLVLPMPVPVASCRLLASATAATAAAAAQTGGADDGGSSHSAAEPSSPVLGPAATPGLFKGASTPAVERGRSASCVDVPPGTAPAPQPRKQSARRDHDAGAGDAGAGGGGGSGGGGGGAEKEPSLSRVREPPATEGAHKAGHRRAASVPSKPLGESLEKISALLQAGGGRGGRGGGKGSSLYHLAHPTVEVPSDDAEGVEAFEEHRERLQQWQESQLRQAIARQLACAPLELPPQWQSTLEALATRAADSLVPDTHTSIHSVLKVKTLPGASRADSHYIDGLVCRMKLAHKSMVTQLDAPRILLLACPLEHERRSFTSSLEALRDQEEEHMGMVVEEIAKQGVNLVLVGGSACLTAKELLLKRGIALAVQVKPSVLQRVARVCNCQVLLSPAQVISASPGQCGRWRVENVSVSDPTAEVESERRARRVTLMYFERCAPMLGATVVLRGGGKAQLRALKHLLASAAFVAADLRAEAAYLTDFGATVPPGRTAAEVAAELEAAAAAVPPTAAVPAAAAAAIAAAAPPASPAAPATPAAAAPVAADKTSPPSTTAELPRRENVARRSTGSRRSLGGLSVGDADALSLHSSLRSPGALSHRNKTLSVEEVLGSSTPNKGDANAAERAEAAAALAADATGEPPEPLSAAPPASDAAAAASTSASASTAAPANGSSSAVTASTSGAGCSRVGVAAASSSSSLAPPAPATPLVPSRQGSAVSSSAASKAGDGFFGSSDMSVTMTRTRELSTLGEGTSTLFRRDAPEEEYFVRNPDGGGGLALWAAASAGLGAGGLGGSGALVQAGEQEGSAPDRLWDVADHYLRVATCWKRGDNHDPPCQVPRERTLPFHLDAPGGREAKSEDLLTLGQFLHSWCFNLRRQCANPRCREGVLRHESCFSHHGGRLSVRVMQLPAEVQLPSDACFAWSVCRECQRRDGAASAGPLRPLSTETLSMSFGRWLESAFYNKAAYGRFCGCNQPFHETHERFVGQGNLAVAVHFQPCVVFDMTPPMMPTALRSAVSALLPQPQPQLQQLGAPAPSHCVACGPSSVAATAEGKDTTVAESAAEAESGAKAASASAAPAASDVSDDGPEVAPTPSTIAAYALSSPPVVEEVARACGGLSIQQLANPDALTSLMRSGDGVAKLEVKFAGAESSGGGGGGGGGLGESGKGGGGGGGEGGADAAVAAAQRACGGLTPIRATVLAPAAFAALREAFCEGGDRGFTQAMWASAPWDSGGGGKSGSLFCKTLDDRYLIKQVHRSEFWSLHEHSRAYFSFVSQTPAVLPSVLVKVLGAILVEFRDDRHVAAGGKARVETQHLVVQENLFHGHTITRMFDLKGAQRTRGTDELGETVLDENLFRFNDGFPLLLSELAKQQVLRSLWNDTLFLSSINVMDYSLLVGMKQRPPPKQGEPPRDPAVEPEWTLVVGLIDYCRQYTWKEEAETRVKRGTVIPPKQYKRRFRDALHRYFMASIEKYDPRLGRFVVDEGIPPPGEQHAQQQVQTGSAAVRTGGRLAGTASAIAAAGLAAADFAQSFVGEV